MDSYKHERSASGGYCKDCGAAPWRDHHPLKDHPPVIDLFFHDVRDGVCQKCGEEDEWLRSEPGETAPGWSRQVACV